MQRYYNETTPIICYETASTKLNVLAVILFLGAALSSLVENKLSQIDTAGTFLGRSLIISFIGILDHVGTVLLISGTVALLIAVIVRIAQSDANRIAQQVRKGIYCAAYGNPLRFKKAERLPAIHCKLIESGLFELTIHATTSTIEDLEKLSSNISYLS